MTNFVFRLKVMEDIKATCSNSKSQMTSRKFVDEEREIIQKPCLNLGAPKRSRVQTASRREFIVEKRPQGTEDGW